MSSWTQADLDAVQNAILKLATGQQKASVSFSSAGASVSTTYTTADLPQLKALRAEIRDELNSAAGKRRAAVAVSRKAL